MKIKTHKYIAKTAVTLVEDIAGRSLNHKMIKMGACAPDIALNRRIKLHDARLAGKQYNKILSKFESGNRSNAFLSYMLGVYSHYVADSFCLAHNNYESDLKSHMKYEIMLQDMMYSVPLPNNIVDIILDKKDNLKYVEVISYMQHENAHYMNKVNKGLDWEENIEIDINLAIINSAVLMLQFVEEVEMQQVLAPVM